MRTSLPVIVLFSTLLSACSFFKGYIPPSTHIPQNTQLKVDPALLGQASPAKPAPPASSQAATESLPQASSAASEAPIKMDPVGLRTQRSIYFDVNSAIIKATYDPALRAHARYLAEHPKARVRIEGNADDRAIASQNLRLGTKRAENVRIILLSYGAGEKQIIVKGKGAGNTKKTGSDTASQDESRRSDIVYEVEE